jgi:hypothetical protein
VRQPVREPVRELLRELPDLTTTPINHCYNVDWLNVKKLMRYLSYIKNIGVVLGGDNILK